MKPARVSEKAEQAAIVKLLETLGAKVYVLGRPSPNDGRTHRGTGQTPGVPDLLAFLGGWQLVAIEVKAKGGRLSPAQVEFQTLARQSGVNHIAGGLDAVIAWLTDRGYLKGTKTA